MRIVIRLIFIAALCTQTINVAGLRIARLLFGSRFMFLFIFRLLGFRHEGVFEWCRLNIIFINY
jgi:hypothetical protein